MSTMAQDYLEYGGPRPGADKVEVMTDGLIKTRLSQSPLREMPGLISKEVADEEWLKVIAEQYVFDVNVPELVTGLVASGQVENEITRQMACLPAPNTWVEWRTDGGTMRIGCLFASNAMVLLPGERSRILMAFAGQVLGVPDRPLLPFGLIGIPTLPHQPGNKLGVYWWARGDQGDISAFFWDALDALFLIMVPKVCEVQEVKRSAKQQKARAKAGKQPLVEYKKMLVRVGVGKPHYKYEGGAEPNGPTGRHHKLHRVTGHFRTYREGRETPKITFVPWHWRGDAKLGVVLHERHVKEPKTGA